MQQAIANQLQVGIRSQFINKDMYKSTHQWGQKRHECFLKFCKTIQSYYRLFQNLTKTSEQKLNKINQGIPSLKQFREYILSFIKILKQVSDFKVQYYTQLQEQQVDPLRAPTFQIINRVNRYTQSQNQFMQLKKKIQNIKQNLQSSYIQLKKDTKDPVAYFDIKQTRTKCNSVLNQIKQQQQSVQKGNIILQTIYQNTSLFTQDISNYRHKILSAKYKNHKKLLQSGKCAKQCIIQTLLQLYQLTGNQRAQFQQLVKRSLRESDSINKLRLKLQGNLGQTIIHATQQYYILIDQLEIYIKALTQGFLVLSNSKQIQQNGRNIVQQLNKLYEKDQNPTPQLIQTLQVFFVFCQKLSDIPTHLHLHFTNLNKLRQNIKKHTQITLSLIKVGGNQSKNKSDPLQLLFDQLSYDYLQDIMQKIYKDIQQTLSSLKNYCNSKFYKKKKNSIQNSMDLSHVEQVFQKYSKKPSQPQMWLWRDFKNKQKYKKIKSIPSEQIKKYINSLLALKAQGKQIQKYNCSLTNKKQLKGQLKILQKCITFSSSNGQIQLVIPLSFVEETNATVKIFQKQLIVSTSFGNLLFAHFPQISRAEVLIQQQMNACTSDKKIPARPIIEILPQQITAMASRKQKLQSQRQKIDGYTQVASTIIQGGKIDLIYDLAYSDKPFVNRGKQECSFMAYALKKGGGSNYTTTPYDSPGPKFYSLVDGKTFANTSIYSTRVNEYQVPLPPIPFMPKTCKNKQTARLYWISDKQFDYLIKSESSGAPYADCFYLNFLHQVKQEEAGVAIKVYFKLTFVKQAAMKGMITSKSNQQAKSKSQLVVSQIQKCYKTMGSAQTTNDKLQSVDKNEQEQQKPTKNIKSLQNQNKILIGALIVVIVINLIIKFVF